jgi:hypothetical protein
MQFNVRHSGTFFLDLSTINSLHIGANNKKKIKIKKKEYDALTELVEKENK